MAKKFDYEKMQEAMKDWPNSWACDDSDIPIGRRIVETMDSFLLAMMEQGLSPGTIRRHAGNLWLLGGEIIFHVQDDRKVRKASGNELILEFVDDQGGSLSSHPSTEEEQRTFDGTCRKFYRFLSRESRDE